MTTRTRTRVTFTLLIALLPLVVVCLLAAPAPATVFNADGAVHDATEQSGWTLGLYCVGAPGTYDGTGPAPVAVERLDLPNTFLGCTVAAAVTAGVNATYTTQAACAGAGYYWDSYVASHGFPNPCFAAFVTADADSPGTWYVGENGCLRCHSADQMATVYGGPTQAKESYLFGGHKNMSRPADGMKWGIPGVDSTHAASPELDEAGLNSDGSFSALWIQEDYPRMPVDWTTGVGAALSSVSVGYCAKDATGAIGSDDVPDLGVCSDCESPIMGNGNAGYPLNYPTQAICEAAKKPSTGTTGYVWIPPTPRPLYWMYGGAGLEGGPAMQQPGSQQYKCGRCHTTGWTANHATDDISAKRPQKDFPTVDFKNLLTLGSATRLLRPSTAGDSATDVSSWDQWGIECSRCHIATDGGHATWPTSSTKGGDVNALCMNCHRMESDTAPRAVAGYNGTTQPIDHNAATPFTNKQQQPDGFAHHPDGPEFLNSPHAKFTGTFGGIGCPPYAINGYGSSITPYAPGAPTECTSGVMNLDGSTSSLYASAFARAAKLDLAGVSDSAAGSCVTCHDVHKPKNENTPGMNAGATRPCTDCHANASASVSPQIDLTLINHLHGSGTPLENAGTDPSSACTVCHQPPGIKHIWRISTDPNYTMFGDYTYAYPVNGASAAGAAKNVNLSNTAPDGAYTNAVWIDLDNACGQCHGGGVSNADVTTTGSITAGSTDGTHINTLTVADPFGFASGKEVTIAGAGVAGADFKTIIAKVSGNTVYLTYPAVTSVTGAIVTVPGNLHDSRAPYFTRAQLAQVAKGMHDSAGVTYAVAFNASVTGLTVTVTATVNCGAGVACPTLTYDWNWGDGAATLGGGKSASHTYASYDPKTIGLTVRSAGKISGTTKKTVTPAPPSVTFTATVTGLKVDVQASASCGGSCPTFTYDWNWGDSSAHGSANPDTHTYAAAGTKTVTLTLSEGGKILAMAARNVRPTTAVADAAPTASATCTWDANTWTATVVDTSTDTDLSPVQTVTVEWGDLSTHSIGGAGATFTHAYLKPPTAPATSYPVTIRAIDSALKSSTTVTLTCSAPVAPAYFTIGGTVFAKNGTTPLSAASVRVMKGASIVKTVYTAANGTFSAGSLKPGTYTLTVGKPGYTFAAPAATITVGPDSGGNSIVATGP